LSYFRPREFLIRKTLTSGAHLSAAAFRARPACQRAIDVWLPRAHAASLTRLKGAVGTARQRPDSPPDRAPLSAPSPRARRPDHALVRFKAASPLSEAHPHCCPSDVLTPPSPVCATPSEPCHRAPSPRCRTAAGHRSPRLVGERCRRSGFSPPSHRQGVPVSYRLHPHARRVTSPPWVLERRLLLRLRRCSAAASHTATHARRASTLGLGHAPLCN
jgi:hypothetical protein